LKPVQFGYHRPATLSEALGLLSELGEEARPLAGGQSLIPLLNMRLAAPAWLVDLGSVGELRHLSAAGDQIKVGAMCTLASLERWPDTAARNPLLAAILPFISHFQIRNRSTLGGNLAHLDPAAELPALALLLGARIELQTSAETRTVTMDQFCLGSMTSSLAPAELVTAATIPWLAGSGWGFAEVSRRRGDFALVGAMAAVSPDRTTRAVVFGAGAVPQRLPRAESAAAAGDLRGAERCAAEEIKAQDDIHASAAYRVAVGARLVRRVVTEALDRIDPAA